jgi:hypothetical protein
MKAEELIRGRAYFMCGFFFRNRPIPEIESWIYVGVDNESDGMWHRFQDPISFYSAEWLAEVLEEEERSEPEVRIIRVRHQDIEMVYSLSELEEFVMTLRKEPHANETF